MKTFTLAEFLRFFNKNFIQNNPEFHIICKFSVFWFGDFADKKIQTFSGETLGWLVFRERGLICGDFRRDFARRTGVSAKPWHFRRHRTAENARVKPRPFKAGRSRLHPHFCRVLPLEMLCGRRGRFFGHRTRKIARFWKTTFSKNAVSLLL